jgi:hypothetical protein
VCFMPRGSVHRLDFLFDVVERDVIAEPSVFNFPIDQIAYILNCASGSDDCLHHKQRGRSRP